MEKTKDPNLIRPQRIRQKNIEIIEKYGKPKTGDAFDDVLSRVLEEYIELKKKRGDRG